MWLKPPCRFPPKSNSLRAVGIDIGLPASRAFLVSVRDSYLLPTMRIYCQPVILQTRIDFHRVAIELYRQSYQYRYWGMGRIASMM